MPPGRPKEFDRDEALERALELLWEKTPDAVGIAELTRHMGIGRQSFYDTYGSKEQLYLEALRRYQEREFAGLAAILRGEGSPMARLSEALAALRRRAEERGKKGCFVVSSIVEHGPSGDAAAEICRGTVEAVDAAFTGLLEEARERGELPGDVEPADLAALILATMFGVGSLGRLGLVDELMPRLSRAMRAQLSLPVLPD